VTIRFRRRGMWLHADTTASSSATLNGSVATIDLGAAISSQSPTKIVFDNGVRGTYYLPFYMIASDDVGGQNKSIEVMIAHTMSSLGGPWSAVNDAAKKAHNTSVLRYTPIDVIEYANSKDLTTLSGISGSYSIICSFRNNSATTDFRVKIGIIGDYANYTPWAVIPHSAAPSPIWVYLGDISMNNAKTLRISYTASAASGSIDVDSIVIFRKNLPLYCVRVVTNEYQSTNYGVTYTIDPQLLTAINGSVLSVIGGVRETKSYSGDIMIHSKSRYIYALLLQVGDLLNNYWTLPDVNNTWTATRTTGYLTPR
jgi:hypothetical protein